MNKHHHKRLQRLIYKHLPKDLSMSPELGPFLASLNAAFASMDRSHQLMEHMFALNEREYRRVLERADRGDHAG